MPKHRQTIGWMWYPDDMEIYHAMLQNFSREERGYGWTGFWHMDDWNKNVSFSRTYELESETSFTVTAAGTGHVMVNGKKYPLNGRYVCGPGKTEITVMIGNMTGLPAIFVDGDIVRSDTEWTASNFLEEKKVGYSSLFGDLTRTPDEVPYKTLVCKPKTVVEFAGARGNFGTLYDFGRMVNGTLKFGVRGGIVKIKYADGILKTETVSDAAPRACN